MMLYVLLGGGIGLKLRLYKPDYSGVLATVLGTVIVPRQLRYCPGFPPHCHRYFAITCRK